MPEEKQQPQIRIEDESKPVSATDPTVEMSAEELQKISGGMSDLSFTKKIDKASPKLMIE